MTKLKVVKALRESILHWERMIKWASERKKFGNTSQYDMWMHIREEWSGNYCALCLLYKHTCIDRTSACPLIACTGDSICCLEWGRVHKSKKWVTWLRNANAMLRRLRFELDKLEKAP